MSAGVWGAPAAAEQPSVVAASRTAMQQAAHHSEYPEASETEDVGLTSQMQVGGTDGTTTVGSSTAAALVAGSSGSTAASSAATSFNNKMADGSSNSGGSGSSGVKGDVKSAATGSANMAQPVQASTQASADSRTGLSITVEVASQVPPAAALAAR